MSSAQLFLLTIATLYASASELESVSAFGVNIKVPENCRKLLEKDFSIKGIAEQNYCDEKPSDYPYEQVEVYMNETFHREYTSFEEHPYEEDKCDGDRNRNCCSSSTTRSPYFIVSENVLKLVLHTKFFYQRFKSTKCLHTGHVCFEDFQLNSGRFNTTCQTDMGSTKLYVYNPVKDIIELVIAKFPVSCSCHITQAKENCTL